MRISFHASLSEAKDEGSCDKIGKRLAAMGELISASEISAHHPASEH
jgi:hypothetical protein